MALNFPSSPVTGQIYSDGNRSWKWNGAAWDYYAPTFAFTSQIQAVDAGSATATSLTLIDEPVANVLDAVVVSNSTFNTATINTATINAGNLVDPSITGAITEDIYTITDAAAFEVDPGNGSIQLITLGANRTPKATNFAAGESLTLMVDDGTAYTLTWTDTTWGPSGVIWTGGVAPTLATTGYTVIEFWKVGVQVYGALVGSVA